MSMKVERSVKGRFSKPQRSMLRLGQHGGLLPIKGSHVPGTSAQEHIPGLNHLNGNPFSGFKRGPDRLGKLVHFSRGLSNESRVSKYIVTDTDPEPTPAKGARVSSRDVSFRVEGLVLLPIGRMDPGPNPRTLGGSRKAGLGFRGSGFFRNC